MAKLILTSGDTRQEFELGPINSIGRHPDNTIQILDRIVSKEHCQVLRTRDGHYNLRDLGSLNGTYVSGKRVSEQILIEGDEIVLGSTRLSYVEHVAEDEQLEKVSIAGSASIDSHIRQKIDASSADFLQEKDLTDEKLLRRDYEKLRISHELSRAIVGVLDLEQLLPKILDKAFEILPADRGVILLVEHEGPPGMAVQPGKDGTLVPRYVKTKKDDGEQIRLSNSILNDVMQNKRAVLSSDATMDSRFSGAHSIIMQGIRSTMCVPLLHADEVLGIMHLDSQIATNAFTEKDLQIFTSIANQAAIAIMNARLAKNIERETQTRAQFQRLLSPNLVEQLVKGVLKLEKGGQQREVTILISDIRGFTSMSEKKPPAEIVAMLNEYFELMVEVLFARNGTLDKYVGDEIMALFGAPVDMVDPELSAVQCALEMMTALGEFNRTRVAEGLEPILIGIGINTGQVVTGAIGSTKTLQYTAIGDPVNTASRLCSIARPGEIIVSETTLQRIAHRVEAQPLPPTKVKGKDEPLQIYNVVGMKGDAKWKEDRTRLM